MFIWITSAHLRIIDVVNLIKDDPLQITDDIRAIVQHGPERKAHILMMTGIISIVCLFLYKQERGQWRLYVNRFVRFAWLWFTYNFRSMIQFNPDSIFLLSHFLSHTFSKKFEHNVLFFCSHFQWSFCKKTEAWENCLFPVTVRRK